MRTINKVSFPWSRVSGSWNQLSLRLLAAALFTSLHNFEDERAAPVEVNASSASRAVAVLKRHSLFKDVRVLLFVRSGRFGARDFENIAKFGEEDLILRFALALALETSVSTWCLLTLVVPMQVQTVIKDNSPVKR